MGIFSMAVCMGACSHNYEELSNGEEEIPGVEPHEVMFSVKNFERDEHSRTHLEVNENGAIFTWAENDTLGIFPSQGDQVTFAMQTGAGTANAVFSGGSWELKKVLLIMRTTLSAENILTDRTRKIKYG